MEACTYEINILVDLGCLIMYEVLILSEPIKTHLTLSSYPKKSKMSDVIEMVDIPTWVYQSLVIHYGKFAAC